MILYVLAGLFVVGGIFMLWNAWFAAFAIMLGTGILAVVAYRGEAQRRDAERRNHVK